MNTLKDKLPMRLGCLAVAMAMTLSACGGGGAGANGGAVGADNGGSGVADILVIADKDTLSTAKDSTVKLTAQLKNARNNVLPNQAVDFSTTDRGVSLDPGSSTRTDAAGKVTWTLTIGPDGIAKTKRAIPVVVTSGGVTRTVDVNVAAPNVKIDGPESMPVGTTADYVVTMLDDSNTGIGGIEIAPTSALGNAVTVLDAQGREVRPPDVVKSAANGQVKFRVAGTRPGDDVLGLAVLGTRLDKPVKVVSAATGPLVQFSAPGQGTDVVIDTEQPVTVRVTDANAPQAGRTVLFTATRGVFVGGGGTTASAVTNANGEATVRIMSASAGTASVTALVQGGAAGATLSATRTIGFVSVTPAKVSLSPNPTSIAVNAPGSSSSTAQLAAVVRDAKDNPVKGAIVAFSAPSDPSGGRIEPATAVTDEAGRATVTFVAGQSSTGANGVTVRATVASAPAIFAEQRMTVSAAALFIELGTGNTIETLDITTYSMPWVAIVTDANRNPVVGARVTPTLIAKQFHKGVWVSGANGWSTFGVVDATTPPTGPTSMCLSEDTNNNNLLDAAENDGLPDAAGVRDDGDGKLDPGSPASVAVTSTGGVTGADGRATLAIVYPKSFGEWVDVELRVTIATNGTESSIQRPFRLPVARADVQDRNISPPNVGNVVRITTTTGSGDFLVGPYGYARDCWNPN